MSVSSADQALETDKQTATTADASVWVYLGNVLAFLAIRVSPACFAPDFTKLSTSGIKYPMNASKIYFPGKSSRVVVRLGFR